MAMCVEAASIDRWSSYTTVHAGQTCTVHQQAITITPQQTYTLQARARLNDDASGVPADGAITVDLYGGPLFDDPAMKLTIPLQALTTTHKMFRRTFNIGKAPTAVYLRVIAPIDQPLVIDRVTCLPLTTVRHAIALLAQYGPLDEHGRPQLMACIVLGVGVVWLVLVFGVVRARRWLLHPRRVPVYCAALVIGTILFPYFLRGYALIPADLLAQRYPWGPHFRGQKMVFDQIHNPTPSDAVFIYYPYYECFFSRLRQEWRLPLWNPYTGLGENHAHNIRFLLAPGCLTFLFVNPREAFTLVVVVHLALAFAFMYRLGRVLGVTRAAGCFGGLLFLMNGCTIGWLANHAHLAADLWVPLLFLALVKCCIQRKRLYVVVAGIALGLHVIHYSQTGAYYGLFCTVFVLLLVFAARLGWRERLRRLVCGVGAAIVAVAVAFFYLRIFNLTFPESRKMLEVGEHALLFGWPNYIDWLIPRVLGTLRWYGTLNYTEFHKYAGVAAAALVCSAPVMAFRSGGAWLRRFGVLLLLCCITASNGSVRDVLFKLPYMNAAAIARMMNTAPFFVAVVAMLVIDGVRRLLHARARWMVLAVALCGFMLYSVLLWFQLGVNLNRLTNVYQHFFSTAGAFLLWLPCHKPLVAAVIGLTFAWFFLALACRGHAVVRIWLLLGFSLLFFDLGYAHLDYQTFSPTSWIFPETAATRRLRAAQGGEHAYRFLATASDILYPNSCLPYRLYDARAISPLTDSRLFHLGSALPGCLVRNAFGGFLLTEFVPSPVYDMLGCSTIVTLQRLPNPASLGLAPAGEDDELFFYANSNAIPRYSLVPYAVPISGEAALTHVSARAFDPRRYCVVETNTVIDASLLSMLPLPTPPTSPGAVHVRRDRIEQAELAVDCDYPCWLVISRNLDRFWRVALDGKPVPLLRANYVLRAIPIETAGRHTVTLTMRMPKSLAGFTVSLLLVYGTFAYCALRALLRWRRYGSAAQTVRGLYP
jgi:hypothetical protein